VRGLCFRAPLRAKRAAARRVVAVRAGVVEDLQKKHGEQHVQALTEFRNDAWYQSNSNIPCMGSRSTPGVQTASSSCRLPQQLQGTHHQAAFTHSLYHIPGCPACNSALPCAPLPAAPWTISASPIPTPCPPLTLSLGCSPPPIPGIPGSVDFIEGRGGQPVVLLKHACGSTAQVGRAGRARHQTGAAAEATAAAAKAAVAATAAVNKA
jgi:hypothetical protein